MSLMNFFFDDLEDDPIFGHQMRTMRQITNMSMLSDPFSMFGMSMPMGHQMGLGLVPANRFNGMPNMNRLLSSPSGMSSFSSSSVFCMSSNGNGQPQIYKETSSVRSGPMGTKETCRTVEDSTTGVKKMAIGHHLGERSRILEKEQNVRTGQREEREELINLEESDTEEFERDFQQRAHSGYSNRRHQLQIEEIGTEPLPAIQSVEDYHRNRVAPSPRRAIRSSPLALPSTSTRSSNESSLLHPHPYSSSMSSSRKQMKSSRKIKGHLNHH